MTEDRKLQLAKEWQVCRRASDIAFRATDGATSTGQAARADRVAWTYSREAGLSSTDAAVAEMRNLLQQRTR